jgi:hypothetical protein
MKKIALLPILIVLTAATLFIAISNYQSPKETRVKPTTTNLPLQKSEELAEEKSTSNTPTSAPQSVVNATLDLVIMSPQSDTTVNATSITVKGTVNPKAYVIINEYDITPGKDGSFEQKIALDEGENYISIVAYDDDGNSSERELLVVRTVEEI